MTPSGAHGTEPVPAASAAPHRVGARLTAAAARALRTRPALSIAVIMLALLSLTAALGYWIHERLEATMRVQQRAVLEAGLATAVAKVTNRTRDAQQATVAMARDSILLGAAGACLRDGAEREACEPLGHALDRFADLLGYTALSVLGARGELLAQHGVMAGVSCDELSPDDIAALPAGQATLGRAQLVAGAPTVPIFAPLVPGDGTRLGALCVDFSLSQIERSLQEGWVGNTGEKYVFDGRGRLLTNSRFVEQLHDAGLLDRMHESAALRVELRDPTHGGALPLHRSEAQRSTQAPLTRMARSALEGVSGADLAGYRDYRGVLVVGAWRWLPELQVGVANELDASEAYAALASLERLFGALLSALSLAVLASLAFAVVNAKQRALTEAAQRRAERFGQYVLEDKLGEGGMGVVYLARHALLRRRAAIKLLRPQAISDEAIERFEVEAQVTSALSHPNTIDVYDFGRTESGELYYVMEYLDGLDLHRLVASFGPLSQARVLDVLQQLCGSLHEAHTAGIVHRDIKPANLFLCTRGGLDDMLKVLDFGIVGMARPTRLSETHEPITLGTPEYMAPELFESGQRASPQSDLYALGVVACYLLTAAHPFAGESTLAISLAHLAAPPELGPLPEGAVLDPTLEMVIKACLAKRPSARPASTASVRQMLTGSALAGAWTQTQAKAWWRQHRSAVLELRAGTQPPSRPSLVRPAPRSAWS